MPSNTCYDCPDRYIGCHSSCEKYKKFKNKLDIAKKNKNKDLAYRRYKSERTCNTAITARAHEHRGFSSI